VSDKLTDAIELIRIGAGAKGYRSYPGTGGMGVGANEASPMPRLRIGDWRAKPPKS
jgi:hypothetical protein